MATEKVLACAATGARPSRMLDVATWNVTSSRSSWKKGVPVSSATVAATRVLLTTK